MDFLINKVHEEAPFSYGQFFGDIYYHGETCLPWEISRMQTMRYVPFVYTCLKGVYFPGLRMVMSVFRSCRRGESILPREYSVNLQKLQTVSIKILKQSVFTLLFLDFAGLTPYQKECRVAADTFLLLATVFGSMKTIKEGTARIISVAKKNQISKKEKIKKLVSGGLLCLMGGWAMNRAYSNMLNLSKGLKLFDSLTPEQQEGVLKYRAIQHLPKDKVSNAVIIDGMSTKWATKYIDDVPLPFGEFTYANGNTQFYRVNSTDSFCGALEDATEQFGEKIDNLQIYGHGMSPSVENSNLFIKLNKNCFFNGTNAQIGCVKEFLKEKAQLFLISCNSATKTEENPVSLSERVFNLLPSIEITGISSFFSPLFMSSWLDLDNRLKFESHFTVDLNEKIVFPQNTVTYSNT